MLPPGSFQIVGASTSSTIPHLAAGANRTTPSTAPIKLSDGSAAALPQAVFLRLSEAALQQLKALPAIAGSSANGIAPGQNAIQIDVRGVQTSSSTSAVPKTLSIGNASFSIAKLSSPAASSTSTSHASIVQLKKSVPGGAHNRDRASTSTPSQQYMQLVAPMVDSLIYRVEEARTARANKAANVEKTAENIGARLRDRQAELQQQKDAKRVIMVDDESLLLAQGKGARKGKGKTAVGTAKALAAAKSSPLLKAQSAASMRRSPSPAALPARSSPMLGATRAPSRLVASDAARGLIKKREAEYQEQEKLEALRTAADLRVKAEAAVAAASIEAGRMLSSASSTSSTSMVSNGSVGVLTAATSAPSTGTSIPSMTFAEAARKSQNEQKKRFYEPKQDQSDLASSSESDNDEDIMPLAKRVSPVKATFQEAVAVPVNVPVMKKAPAPSKVQLPGITAAAAEAIAATTARTASAKAAAAETSQTAYGPQQHLAPSSASKRPVSRSTSPSAASSASSRSQSPPKRKAPESELPAAKRQKSASLADDRVDARSAASSAGGAPLPTVTSTAQPSASTGTDGKTTARSEAPLAKVAAAEPIKEQQHQSAPPTQLEDCRCTQPAAGVLSSPAPVKAVAANVAVVIDQAQSRPASPVPHPLPAKPSPVSQSATTTSRPPSRAASPAPSASSVSSGSQRYASNSNVSSMVPLMSKPLPSFLPAKPSSVMTAHGLEMRHENGSREAARGHTRTTDRPPTSSFSSHRGSSPVRAPVSAAPSPIISQLSRGPDSVRSTSLPSAPHQSETLSAGRKRKAVDYAESEDDARLSAKNKAAAAKHANIATSRSRKSEVLVFTSSEGEEDAPGAESGDDGFVPVVSSKATLTETEEGEVDADEEAEDTDHGRGRSTTTKTVRSSSPVKVAAANGHAVNKDGLPSFKKSRTAQLAGASSKRTSNGHESAAPTPNISRSSTPVPPLERRKKATDPPLLPHAFKLDGAIEDDEQFAKCGQRLESLLSSYNNAYQRLERIQKTMLAMTSNASGPLLAPQDALLLMEPRDLEQAVLDVNKRGQEVQILQKAMEAYNAQRQAALG